MEPTPHFCMYHCTRSFGRCTYSSRDSVSSSAEWGGSSSRLPGLHALYVLSAERPTEINQHPDGSHSVPALSQFSSHKVPVGWWPQTAPRSRGAAGEPLLAVHGVCGHPVFFLRRCMSPSRRLSYKKTFTWAAKHLHGDEHRLQCSAVTPWDRPPTVRVKQATMRPVATLQRQKEWVDWEDKGG